MSWITEQTFREKLNAVADALGAARADGTATVYICHGVPRCEGVDGGPCLFCQAVAADDPRPTAEIIEVGKRGH